jgi:hypothetical protein
MEAISAGRAVLRNLGASRTAGRTTAARQGLAPSPPAHDPAISRAIFHLGMSR